MEKKLKQRVIKKVIPICGILLLLAVASAIVGYRSMHVTQKNLTIHFKWNQSTPYLYYDSEEGSEQSVCAYPGIPMTNENNGWYSCTISDIKSANVTINVPDMDYATVAAKRESGEWWLNQGLWYSENPDKAVAEDNTSAKSNMMSVSSVNKAGSDSVIVHMYSSDAKPNIYFWNALPEDQETAWPGKEMAEEKNGWYSYEFDNCSKINLLFLTNGEQSEEFTRTAGEWWYDGSTWTDKDPNGQEPTAAPTASTKPSNRPDTTPIPGKNNDFREETIYFVMTARFYDGDKSNNIHCDHDAEVGNSDSDPAWRGDFKGLIEKLDYIKALGFSAVWITPVAENASGYDFHGYHAINFQKVDPRLESNDADYQTLINEAHKRDMKIIQDIVLNHTGNAGEEGMFPMMDRTYTLDQGVSGNSYKMTPKASAVDKLDEFINKVSSGKFTTYDSAYSDTQDGPSRQYQARDQWMKSDDMIYRKKVDIGWEDFTVTTGQFAGDCMELNTELPTVYNYLVDSYSKYIKMGVDAFRIDTVKHISRLTMNTVFLPEFKKAAKAAGNDNFYMYAEVACRTNEFINHGVKQVSPFYYTWKSPNTYAWNDNSEDGKDNLELCKQEYKDGGQVQDYNKYNNAKLEGNNYHEPDHSEFSGMGVIDYGMHFSFAYANKAFQTGVAEDEYMNDSTYNVVYVDSHDYGPGIDGRNDQDGNDLWRYDGGTEAWAENLNLMFTFRGIPCLYYGSEVEFKAGLRIDNYKEPLENTGRAYFGDYLEGEVTASDFSTYKASGKVAETLNNPLAKHIQRLNQIRRAVPALQKGQYSQEGVDGNMAFKRRYTDSDTDSFACVAITNGATFSGLPGGTYTDVVTGDSQTIGEGGTLTISEPGKGNMRVYVLSTAKTKAPGKIGENGSFLK